jgi:large subunit ribosomal protein L1
MGSKKNVVKTMTEDTVKIVADPVLGAEISALPADIAAAAPEVSADLMSTEVNAETAESKKAKKQRSRSKKYHSARAQVDKTKAYDTFAAVELLKKLSYSKFAGTVTVDLIVKEAGVEATLSFPHSTGKTVTATIVTEEVLKQIEAGQTDFQILITEPRFMGQLAKFARVLGPKGLMPNPKNGTVTTNPELKKQELEGGKVTVKTEKKNPLMHIVIGKTNMETDALVENIQTLFTSLKGKIVKASISASMSPGIRVSFE